MRSHILLILAFAISGCAGASQAMKLPTGTTGTRIGFNSLSRDEYKVIGTTEGWGCATYTGLWPLPIFWTSGEAKGGRLGESSGFEIFSGTWHDEGGVSTSWFSANTRGRAEATAIYNAIENAPGADMLLTTRYRADVSPIGIWHEKVCVTVYGKAISLKTDEELAADLAEERSYQQALHAATVREATASRQSPAAPRPASASPAKKQAKPAPQPDADSDQEEQL